MRFNSYKNWKKSGLELVLIILAQRRSVILQVISNLLGSYSCWLVGQYTTFTGYEKVRQGNIHFAGEHCSFNYQGYMEGGAREGKRAANEILKDYHLIV